MLSPSPSWSSWASAGRWKPSNCILCKFSPELLVLVSHASTVESNIACYITAIIGEENVQCWRPVEEGRLGGASAASAMCNIARYFSVVYLCVEDPQCSGSWLVRGKVMSQEANKLQMPFLANSIYSRDPISKMSINCRSPFWPIQSIVEPISNTSINDTVARFK